LKKIEEQAQRIKNLVSRLLNFSRPKEAEYSDIDLNDIIRETQELFGKQITKTGTDLNLKLSKKPLIIYGDQGRIQQVLINLLINAKDSLKENGIIDIKSYKESDFAVLSVEDNGIGISEDHLRRIYDPFFTTKKDTGGTGLGLSISYAIIRDHLGTISVKSRLYKGTSFIVRLPLLSSRGK
jgi:signal transduction histidine kinase